MNRVHPLIAGIVAGVLGASGAIAAPLAAPADYDALRAPLPFGADEAARPAPTTAAPAAARPETSLAVVELPVAELVVPERASADLKPLVEARLAALATEGGRREKDVAAAKAFYAERQYEPVWHDRRGFTGRARATVGRLAEAGDDGLEPSAYQIILPRDGARPGDLAAADIEITLAALRFAREARLGRLAASSLGELVESANARFDEANFLKRIAHTPDPAAVLDAQNPQAPEFRALRAKLKEMRQYTGTVKPMAAIPAGQTLKIGIRDAAVPALRARLDVAARPEADETVFDPELAAAVRTFQKDRGLSVDGVVGPRTRQMLNAPVSVTAADIIVNMERWRWLPRELGRHHVFVNIPEFKVRVVDGGRTTFETRVIVGKTTNRTPVFSDEIEYVDVNPYWNVPYSIATKEMLPEARKDPNYFHRAGIQVLYTGNGKPQLIDSLSVDWSQVTPGNMPFRFRQPPGDANALGRVKFMFPNKHAVYLHDTPSRGLFQRSQRALSHGCVRVEDPVAFADALLVDESALDGAKIKRLIGGGENGAHSLRAHVPVHLTYFTIWADGDGELRRWDDVYGYDREMKRLLGYAA